MQRLRNTMQALVSYCELGLRIIMAFILNRIIVSLVAYFIIGALLMKFQFQASGTDVVPNKTFWIQLPLLIKVKQRTIPSFQG